MWDEIIEPGPSPDEMINDIVEYNLNNMSWADIKEIVEASLVAKLKEMPPEALSFVHDGIFNR